MAVGKSCPEILRGNALKDEQEEEEGAVDLGDDESDPENMLVDRSDAQAQQHKSYAGLECHV